MSASAPTNHHSTLIQQELRAILRSAEFSRSERLCRFLKFVVDQYLQGTADSLKETVIGVAVFDRQPGYDPKLEPIVRTEARRLRIKLENYYDASGREHSVRIRIPKGGYVPVVEVLRPPVVALPARIDPTPPSEPLRSPWLRRWMVVGAGAALLLGAATAMILLRSPRERPADPVEITVTSFPGDQLWPSFSPDGSQLAFSWDGDARDNRDIFVMMTAGGMLRRLTTDPLPDQFPAWSPDGSTIAFVRAHQDVILISPMGGQERKVATASYPSIAWTADSQSLAYVSHLPGVHAFSIFLISLRTGEIRAMTHPPPESEGDYEVAFSPDGRYMAFSRCGVGLCDLYIMPAEGGELRRIVKATGSAAGLTWTPDSRDLLYSTGPTGAHKLWRASISHPDAPAMVPGTGDDASLPTMVRTGPGRGNRVQLAYSHEERVDNIWSVEIAGLALRSPGQRFMNSTKVDSSPQFSPDGRKIAFSSTRIGPVEDIWVCDGNGRNPVRLTSFTYGSAGSPRWSPDARQIVFDYLNQNGRAIYAISAAGGPLRRLTAYGGCGRPSWSRNGQWVYFFKRSGHIDQIYKVAADSNEQHLREPLQVTTGGGTETYESVDGATLYYERDHELWSQPVGGGAAVRLLPYMRHGWWSVLGEGIVWVDLRNGEGKEEEPKPVMLFDPRTRRLSKIGVINGILHSDRPDFCVSPDFRLILYVRGEFNNSGIRMLFNPR